MRNGSVVVTPPHPCAALRSRGRVGLPALGGGEVLAHRHLLQPRGQNAEGPGHAAYTPAVSVRCRGGAWCRASVVAGRCSIACPPGTGTSVHSPTAYILASLVFLPSLQSPPREPRACVRRPFPSCLAGTGATGRQAGERRPGWAQPFRPRFPATGRRQRPGRPAGDDAAGPWEAGADPGTRRRPRPREDQRVPD